MARKKQETKNDNKENEGILVATFLEDEDFSEPLEAKEVKNPKALEKIMKDPSKIGQPYRIKTMRGPKKILSQVLLRIPLLGELILRQKIKQGYIIAEVTFPNQYVMRYLVSTDSDYIEIKKDDSYRFFNIDPLRKTPEKYIKYEDGKPIVTFNWNYPNPLPIRPTVSEKFDLNTYGILVIRQRSKAGAKLIQEFLENAAKDLKLIKITSLVAAVGAVAFIANVFGFLGG